MNFGIGKMKPCGNSHYHKYSHCKNGDDMKHVCHDFSGDCNLEKEWHYDLNNLNHAGFKFTVAEKFDKTLPNCTSVVHMFSPPCSLKYLKLIAPKCINGSAMGIQQTKCITKIGILPEATSVSSWNQQMNDYSVKHEIKLYAPKATKWSTAFASDMNKPGYPDVFEFVCDSMEIGDTLFGAWAAQQNRFEVRLDEDGNYCMLTDKSEVSRRFITFPKLKTGKQMFGGASLDKDYVIAVCRDLPDWSNDGSEHIIQLRFHPDWKYDKELNLELKKIDKTWESAIDLDEEITKDKGWHIARWNENYDKWPLFYPWTGKWDHSASFTKNEVISPAFIEKIDLENIILPDGFQRCKFLEDNGTQYIDTGCFLDNETGMYVIAKQINYVKRSNPPMGVADKTKIYISVPEWNKDNSSYLWWDGAPYSIFVSFEKQRWYGHGSIYEGCTNWLNSKKSFILTSHEQTWEKTLDDFVNQPVSNIHIFPLFNINKDHSYSATGWNGRIYRAKISQGSEIIHDYIPCLDTNGRPCMYDILGTGTVEENSFYNMGDGEDFSYELA